MALFRAGCLYKVSEQVRSVLVREGTKRPKERLKELERSKPQKEEAVHKTTISQAPAVFGGY